MSNRRVMAALDVPTTLLDPNTKQAMGRETQKKYIGFAVDQTLEEVYDEIKKYGISNATILFESVEPEPRKPHLVDPEN